MNEQVHTYRANNQGGIEHDLAARLTAWCAPSLVTRFIPLALIAFTVNAADPPSFSIKVRRSEDRIDVQTAHDRVTFAVHSPSGIGKAVISRNDAHWPGTVTFQMWLKGLEQWSVSNGQVTLNAAVSSHDGQIRVWKDEDERSPVDAKSIWWAKVSQRRQAKQEGQRQPDGRDDPEKGKVFEITLPKAMFADNPSTITLSWIDFFRS